MQFRTQNRLDGFINTSIPIIENFTDFERFLRKSVLNVEINEKNPPFWTHKQIIRLLSRITIKIPQEIIHFCQNERIDHIPIDFYFQQTPGCIKIISSMAEGQIFIGKLHRWSQKLTNIYIILFDFFEQFVFPDDAIPSNVNLIKYSGQLKNSLYSREKSFYQTVEINPKSGYWGFQVNDPLEFFIKGYIGEYIKLNPLKQPEIKPELGEIMQNLQNFPMDELLKSAKIQEFFNKLTGEMERFIEWILSEFLLTLYPNTFINQYRSDHNIFDMYWPDKLIIECKWVKTTSDWDRCIGQVWTYARYQIPIVIYAIQQTKVKIHSKNVFPSLAYPIIVQLQ